ncbi:MAG: hypothetical protein AAGH73_02465 [Pseudomonadota bacterium]
MDIRIVLGVVTLLFAYLAFFSEGDHSINIVDKFTVLVEDEAPAEDSDS